MFCFVYSFVSGCVVLFCLFFGLGVFCLVLFGVCLFSEVAVVAFCSTINLFCLLLAHSGGLRDLLWHDLFVQSNWLDHACNRDNSQVQHILTSLCLGY